MFLEQCYKTIQAAGCFGSFF